MFRENGFPGGLDKSNGFFRFIAVDLYRYGTVSPVFLIEKEHGFNLIMKRIKIEIFGYAHDIAKRVESEMFTEQGRRFGFRIIFQQLLCQRFIDDIFFSVGLFFMGEISSVSEFDLVEVEVIRINNKTCGG